MAPSSRIWANLKFSDQAKPLPLLFSKYLALVLVGVAVSLIMAAAYFSVVSAGPLRVTWAVNPLTLTPSMTSATDSFTCSGSVSGVTVVVGDSRPGGVQLEATPNSFGSCGSTPDVVTFSFTCPSGCPLVHYEIPVELRTSYFNLAHTSLRVVVLREHCDTGSGPGCGGHGQGGVVGANSTTITCHYDCQITGSNSIIHCHDNCRITGDNDTITCHDNCQVIGSNDTVKCHDNCTITGSNNTVRVHEHRHRH